MRARWQPLQVPGEAAKRKLISFATRKAVETVVSKHYYNFGGKLYIQTRGAA